MKTYTFAIRVAKEILRDPLNAIFGIGFPVVLLLLLSAIQANIPVSLFALPHLTPGISVFGLSFLTLFSATLIAKDRSGSFLQRLFTTPLTAADFIFGYTLPMIPIGILQTAITYLVAIFLGLQPTVNILWAIASNLPMVLFFIALGLLCGTCFNDKQVGGLCGALLTNLTAWLSGTWFDLTLVGDAFQKIANLFPFVHAVEWGRAVLKGTEVDYTHILWVLGYAIGILFVSVLVFLTYMRRK